MKKLKKALSLTLALALSLALAAPAFADDDYFRWNLSVPGKSAEEIILPPTTFTRLSWDTDYDSERDCDNYKKDVETMSYELDESISLKAGDTMVLTVTDPASIMITAWSDPDGDGVYEQRLYEARGNSESWTYEVLPLTTASPLLNVYDDSLAGYKYSDTCFLATNGQLGWTPDLSAAYEKYRETDEYGWVDVTVSADYLLQQFGPNTYLDVFGYLSWGLAQNAYWYVYLSGDSQPSAPSAPAEPEQPAAPAEPEQPAAPSGISVTVGGTAVTWTDAAPFIDANNRTMVPLRAVADAMGLEVNWDASAREASFTDGGETIYFPIDSNSARTSDGGAVQMDTAAVIVNDRTYAPIRYLAEYFGYEVGWDAATQTVSLTK